MSKEIKIGLIGAGWMGKAHTTAFHNARMIFGDDMPVFELVSDVSEDAVAKFAKNMGYNRYTTNWMDVVTDPEIDLVDVATPNCMHYEMAKAALEHGKHVFCEKPLSLSAEQSRELADLAKEKGVVNYCGFSNIMNPANQYVAELVKSGKLGKIMRVHATYDQDMLLGSVHSDCMASHQQAGRLGRTRRPVQPSAERFPDDHGRHERGARRSVHRYSGASDQGRQH